MATALHPAVTTPNITAELAALLHGAGVAQLTDRAFLRITGPDATRWLNGMVTNSIESLKPGEGNYNFLLNAQGRIQGDCTIYREPHGTEPKFVLATDTSQIDNIQQLLEKFIIMDDVELKRMDYYGQGVLLVGPKVADMLRRIENPLLSYTSSLAHLGPLEIGYYDLTAEQVTTPSQGLVPRFKIATSTDGMAQLTLDALIEAGATPVSPEALEHLRILEGTPLYGTDIRNSETARDLPQETAAVGVPSRALHFSKGCYLGQEIVERIHSRGAVHRTFTGFELTGALPPSGTPLEAEGKSVGELTSVASIQLPNRDAPIQLALGYIRREALDRGLPLQYPGGTAVPIPLPYSNI